MIRDQYGSSNLPGVAPLPATGEKAPARYCSIAAKQSSRRRISPIREIPGVNPLCSASQNASSRVASRCALWTTLRGSTRCQLHLPSRD
jgi:hypothetical protein